MSLRRAATRIYAVVLRAFPRRHREQYAPEMIDTFDRELAGQRREHGNWRALRFVLAAGLDAVSAGLGERLRHWRFGGAQATGERRRGGMMRTGMSWLDVKLGLRMLVRYKGLTLAGGLALAGAIGIGAAWYDVVGDQLHPRLPLPEGHRLVEVEMRNASSSKGEWRVLHDFLNWRRDVRAIEELGAIVGMVRDIGMTPTNFGEAPYVYRAVSAATSSPLVMGVRTAGDPEALAARVRVIATGIDPGLRLDDVQSLDALVWSEDAPMLASSGAFVAVVVLGLCMSAAGIFSLMSVSVARRTREIGLRAALGASRGRLLAGIFSRAIVLVGSGIAAGNVVLNLPGLGLADGATALLRTSAVMLTVGLLACVGPARRVLRIDPTEALKAT